MNRPVHHETFNMSQKRFCFIQYTNIDKVGIFLTISYMIMLHYQHGDILSVEQKIVSKGFLERFGPDKYKALIKRWSFYDSPGGSKLYETIYYFLKKIGFFGKLFLLAPGPRTQNRPSKKEPRHKILLVSSCYITLYPFLCWLRKV